MCCERCYCRAAPSISKEARRWKPPRVEHEQRKPTPYAQLFQEVYGALQAAGQTVTGEEFCVFGLGDPAAPYTGYCPACRTGIVSIRLVPTDPPRPRVGGCSDGCSPEVVRDAIWPLTERST